MLPGAWILKKSEKRHFDFIPCIHYNVMSDCILTCQGDETVKQLTLRGVDSNLHHDLKAEADRRGLSVNRYILSVLRGAQGVDASDRRAAVEYHELDHLAGTWSQADGADFERQLAAQRSIDEDLWV